MLASIWRRYMCRQILRCLVYDRIYLSIEGFMIRYMDFECFFFLFIFVQKFHLRPVHGRKLAV